MNFFTILQARVSVVFAVVMLLCTSLNAQISAGGTPPSFRYQSTLRSLDTLMVSRLPLLDMREIEREDREDAIQGRNPRSGYGLPVNADILKDGIWTELPTGEHICRYQFRSEDAVVLSLLFSKFKLAEGDKLFVYNEDGSHIQGAFTSANNKPSGKFATAMLVGGTLNLEFVTLSTQDTHTSEIIISNVVNYYTLKSDPSLRNGGTIDCRTSLECQVNINCPEGAGWQVEKRGVAMYAIPYDDRNDGFTHMQHCSGSLINNTRMDGAPLFLTADHCLPESINPFKNYDATNKNKADDWIFYWNFESPNCNGICTQELINNASTTCGAFVLANDDRVSSTDFALLYLTENPQSPNSPPPLRWNGWELSPDISGRSVGIHHPNGDIKKISIDNDSPINSPDSPNRALRYYRLHFDNSPTQGGSSGSPIFNENKLIYGQLWGGERLLVCPEMQIIWKEYGKLSYSWTNGTRGANDQRRKLSSWLDPDKTSVTNLTGANYNSPNSPQFTVVSVVPICQGNNTYDLSIYGSAPFGPYKAKVGSKEFRFIIHSNPFTIRLDMNLLGVLDGNTLTPESLVLINLCDDTETYLPYNIPDCISFCRFIASSESKPDCVVTGASESFVIPFSFSTTAGSYRITTSPLPTSGTGTVNNAIPNTTYTLGPFPNNTNVYVIVTDVDKDCSITFGPYTRDCNCTLIPGSLTLLPVCIDNTNNVGVGFEGTSTNYTINAGYRTENNANPNTSYEFGPYGNGLLGVTVSEPNASCTPLTGTVHLDCAPNAGKINITNPVANACIHSLSTIPVNWNPFGSGRLLTLEACYYGTNICAVIGSDIIDDGSYSFQAGELTEGDYYLKLYDPAFTSYNGRSGPFTVSGTTNCGRQSTGFQDIMEGQCYDINSIQNITWDPLQSVNGQVVLEICLSDGSQCFVIANPTADDGSYTWNVGHLMNGNVMPVGNYFFKIYEEANTSNITFSSQVTLSTNCSSCTAPTNLNSNNSGANAVQFTWNAVTGISEYQIEYSVDGGQTWSILSTNYASTSYNFTNLPLCRSMDFRVASVCEVGLSDYTTIHFVTLGCSGPGGGNGTLAIFNRSCPGDDEDDEDPFFLNCPDGFYLFGVENSDHCTAYVNWAQPIALDNCNVTVRQISGPANGSEVSAGTYSVTYLAEDNNGNSATCSFLIYVLDNQTLEFVNCPTGPMVFGNDPDQCSVTANWSIPVATDNCAVTINHISGPRPGDELSPGTYRVIYEATNNAIPAETATCAFDVIINETQFPYLDCPQDVTVSNDPGVCEAVVNNIQLEFAFDNCPYTVTWTSSPTDVTGTGTSTSTDASGAIFPVGITTVTYTITENDDFGNGIQSSSCDIIVTVIDDERPVITCPDDVTIGTSMGGIDDCYGEYTWLHPNPTDNCGVTIYTLTFTNPDGTVEGPVNLLGLGGTSITRDFYKGVSSMLYRVEDAAGNWIECTFTVTVLDDENPEIFCEELTSCTAYTMTTPLDIKPNDVSTFTFDVPADIDITDVNIRNMSGSHPAMEHVTITLTSPSGTVVTLFDSECTGPASFTNIGMDDTGSGSYVAGPCNLVSNFSYIPATPLSAFNGERSGGAWTLSVTSLYTESCGSIDTWTLEICGNDVTAAGNRLQVLADPGTCDYTMLTTGFNPRFTDNCPDPYIRHDYIFGPFDHTLQGSKFALGESLIQWTVYDQSGNTASCHIIVDVLDNQAPEFLNCPRLDIVQNAEIGECGAYVTFSDPIAMDNCNSVTVTQVDGTGLASGSVFPVGMTILEWMAEDPSGNISRCSLRVIVNDTQLPNFACRGDVIESTDPWKCSAIVQNLAPVLKADNCIDNMAVTWQIEYPAGSGIILQGGAHDASGERFLDGTSTVHYHIQTQPLLLITEVTHAIGITNGGMDPVPYTVKTGDDYVEITNIGPASMNISGLTLERLGNVIPEEWIVPDNTIMGVGQTLVVHFGNGDDDPANLFFNVPCAIDMATGQGAAYVMSFKGRVLDVVAVNGYAPVGQGTAAVVQSPDWTGSIPTMRAKGGVFRKFSYDNDRANDWDVAEVCMPITIGQVNPSLDIMPDNGTVSAFQSIAPHTADCSFDVTILDQELPYCGEFIENIYTGATNLNVPNSITGGKIYRSVISVPDNFVVGDVDILNIVGIHPEMSDLEFRITSPEGTTVTLINGQCAGTANFNLSLDSDSLTSVLLAPCGPLGGGGTFVPLQSLNAVNYGFYGENAQGDWLFEICDSTAANSGMLTGWTLRLWEINNYSQGDTIYNNEPGRCGADFTWVHPRLIDNCKEGTVELKYLSENDIPLPVSPGFIVQADTITEFFAVGTTIVRYILTDGSGNVDSCEFRVTIVDVDRPQVYCPNDIIIQLKGGECRTFVCYWPIIATDNCAVVDTAYSILPCVTYFEIGTTPVTIYVYDEAGNVDSCTFNVIVNEYVPRTSALICNDHLNLSLDQDCTAEITPDMLFEGGEYRCYEDYIVELFDISGNLLPTSPFVYIEHEGMTLTYVVTDPETNNSCSGTILIEAKAIPLIACPADTLIYCSTNKDLKNEFGKLLLGEVELLSCKPDIIITREDVVVKNNNCSDPIANIYRTFVVSDRSGNSTSCTQQITVSAFNFDQIVWPADALLSCDTVSRYPGLIHPDVLGFPTIGGVIVDKVNALCNLSHTYEDQYLWICGGSYEIIRKWVIRNRCEPISAANPIVYYQLIEVLDTKSPILYPCPDEVVFSVDPWSCSGSGYLPIPENIGDKCSAISFNAYIYGGGFLEIEGSLDSNNLKVFVYHVKKGANTRVKYVLTDECGNESTCIFPIRVLDQTAPVAIAKQNIVMSLTGGSTSGDGVAKLFAWQVDDGSYDQCTKVKLEIRRLDGGDCGNTGANGSYNNNQTYNNHNGLTSAVAGVSWLHPDDNVNDTDGGEYVKFCCEDIPQGEEYGVHQVELRVWDDGNMNGIIGDNLIVNGLKDNHNTTWADIRIDNKIPPQIVCPPDVTVTCDMELNLSLNRDTNIDTVDLTMTGLPKSIGVCDQAIITYRDAGSLDDCNRGSITRTFTATIGSKSATCTQRITIVYIEAPFTVTFPNNEQTTKWDQCSFDMNNVIDRSDSRIKRPVANYGQCDIVGENVRIDTFLFEDGACKKWKVSYTYKNWCTGVEIGPFVHYYAFKDEVAPELVCNDQMFEATPPISNPSDGCEGNVVLEASASDALVCAEESWIKWQVFFDGWSNGTVDRLGSGFVNKAWANQWVQIDRFINGSPNPAWTALQAQHPGVILEDVVYVTYVNPSKASGGIVKLPTFTLPAENIRHKVLWKITDGCGNVDQCESTVMVIDKKAPTPYCVHISTAIMQTNPKMVELWAKDFDKGSFDNCTQQSKLYYTFDEIHPVLSKLNHEHYFKANPGQHEGVDATSAEYNSGRAQKWIPATRTSGKVWTTCGTFNTIVSVWDEAWNTDYCEAELKVIGCEGNLLISGHVATATGSNVADVHIIFEGSLPEYPKQFVTDKSGDYSMDVQPDLDYNVHAVKGGDYINGVSTLDLVLIQRHILGLEEFTDPYHLIASDANNDGYISASDLTEIRKLVLGVKDEFKNQSWRFPVKSQQMSMPDVMPYIEQYEYTKIADNQVRQDFVAVKIGDVNSSVVLDLKQLVTEARTSKALIMEVDNLTFEEGALISIPFRSAQAHEIMGFQLTMNTTGFELVGIDPGMLNVDMTQAGIFAERDMVTMSYASKDAKYLVQDDILFTMNFIAKTTGNIGDALSFNSQITKVESYDSNLQVGDVKLNIRGVVGDQIVLYQNEPNPYVVSTDIHYWLPEAQQVTITLNDVVGHQIKKYTIEGTKGMNILPVSKEQLGITGIVFYTLDCGNFSDTKKMIILE